MSKSGSFSEPASQSTGKSDQTPEKETLLVEGDSNGIDLLTPTVEELG